MFVFIVFVFVPSLRKTCRYHTLKMKISRSVMHGGHTLSVNIYALTVGVFA